MSWAVFKPWVMMALIFGVGMVAGGALVVAFHPAGMSEPPPNVQDLRNHWMMHLSHRLNLTADQQAKIAPILDDATSRIESLHREEVGNLGKIMDETNGKIAQFLTAEQKAQLAEMRNEREREFSGHMRPWHGPGGPGGPGEGGPHHDFESPPQAP